MKRVLILSVINKKVLILNAMKSVSYLMFCLLFTFVMACNNDDCYDAELEKNHPGICVQDCPQVCGCDGQTYCNECIANSRGIRIDHSGPCN